MVEVVEATEEVTKGIINKHQINKVEIMVQNNSKENNQQTPNQQGGNNGTEQQQGERNHEYQGQPEQNNGNQWDPCQVVCYECFRTGHYSRGFAYRGRGGNPNHRGSGHRGRH